MKKLGAVLLIAGVFVAAGAALAGPDTKCKICHYGSHNVDGIGDVVEVSRSGWGSSHKVHGDCVISPVQEGEYAGYYVNEDGYAVEGPTDLCACEPAISTDPEPDPTDPPPTAP